MRAAKLTIAPDARAALVSLIGGDRQASRSEIRKLALYAHGTGALPPGVEGGLDAQTVYRD